MLLFLEGDHSVACGAVVRDSTGLFTRASTSKSEHVADIVSAEAAALAEGLKLAQSIDCNFILVQVDNLVVVEALKSNTVFSMVAPVLDECRQLIKEFGKLFLKHCNRESNMVAHVLPTKGRLDPPFMRLDRPPDFISEFLANDISVN